MPSKPPSKPVPTSQPIPQPVPPPVCAALEYLAYVKGVSAGGRKLDINQLRCQDTAIEVVRGYLSIAAKHIIDHEERLEQGIPPPAPTGSPSEN